MAALTGAFFLVYVAFVLIALVSTRTEASTVASRWGMGPRASGYSTEEFDAVLGVVLGMVAAEIGHAAEDEVFAVGFDALELFVVVVYKPDWLVAGVRSFRAT